MVCNNMSDTGSNIDLDALRQQWQKYLQSQPYITATQTSILRSTTNCVDSAFAVKLETDNDIANQHIKDEIPDLEPEQTNNTVDDVPDDLAALDALAEQPADDDFIETLRRKSMRWQPHSTKKIKKRLILESSESGLEIDAELQQDTDQQIDTAIQRSSIHNTDNTVHHDVNQCTEADEEIIDLCGSDDSESEMENAQTFTRMSRKFDLNILSDSESDTDTVTQHDEHTSPVQHDYSSNEIQTNHDDDTNSTATIEVDDNQLYPVSPLMLSVRKKKPVKRIIESDDSGNENVDPNVNNTNTRQPTSVDSPEFVKPNKPIKTRDRVLHSDFKSKIAAANQARKQIVVSDDSDSASDTDTYKYDNTRHSSDDDFVVDDDDTGYNDAYSDYSDSVDDGNDNNDTMLTKHNRESYTAELYAEYNQTVLKNVLPTDMKVEWNQKLNKTAGYCYMSTLKQYGQQHYNARIELSIKVVDRLSRLRRTLAHEMCHAAAWLIDHCNKPPHGKTFKYYANKFMLRYSELEISTCHSYEIFYKYRWQCIQCQHIYGRHSNSVDISKKCCGKCSGQLIYLGHFDQKINTAKKDKKPATGFALYMKQNYSAVKHQNRDCNQKELFQLLSAQYKSSKHSVDALTDSVARQLQL